MRIKTLLIIIFTVLITVFLMMNTDAVEFNFIFGKGEISKLVIVGACTLFGFILGYWVGRPRKVVTTYDSDQMNGQLEKPGDRLSEEDRDYIN